MDEDMLDGSFSDLKSDIDAAPNAKLLQKLMQALPACSELNFEMFSPNDLRSSTGKQDIISDHMYSLHLKYFIWKQQRKVNEEYQI